MKKAFKDLKLQLNAVNAKACSELYCNLKLVLSLISIIFTLFSVLCFFITVFLVLFLILSNFIEILDSNYLKILLGNSVVLCIILVGVVWKAIDKNKGITYITPYFMIIKNSRKTEISMHGDVRSFIESANTNLKSLFEELKKKPHLIASKQEYIYINTHSIFLNRILKELGMETLPSSNIDNTISEINKKTHIKKIKLVKGTYTIILKPYRQINALASWKISWREILESPDRIGKLKILKHVNYYKIYVPKELILNDKTN